MALELIPCILYGQSGVAPHSQGISQLILVGNRDVHGALRNIRICWVPYSLAQNGRAVGICGTSFS
jgi:hypothetical protein